METDNPFEKVLDHLREKGWAKYTMGESYNSASCIRGAAFWVLREWNTVCDVLAPIIYEQYRPRAYGKRNYLAVLHFNDHHSTTFEDVERVLEKAAIKWEEDRVLGE